VEKTLSALGEKQFDLVTLWHVLEHLSDPSSVMCEIYRILKPQGLLMLEVPNFDSLPSSLFGNAWFTLEAPRHLYHFTPKTVSALLKKHHFKIAKLKGVPAPQAVAWSFQIFWKRWTGQSQALRLSLNPALLALILPLDWFMARFCMSSVISITATKPLATMTPGVH
jgi:ubiquinone/menaquinone biosynthesis C-methylase UbiE